ncbi:MAG TPA: hypothetical protein VNH41_03455 [Steroidobacteraceae bacterium]|nr:hypothetical protein [Steroidobacteraceae bacterium]
MNTSDTALANSIRIAASISKQTQNGMSLRNAIRQASQMLGISEAAVCHSLTLAQDFVADLSELTAVA